MRLPDLVARPARALSAWILLVPSAGLAMAQDVTAVEPSLDVGTEVHEWRTEDGLAYRYRLPLEREDDAPIGLTLILHGSNLDRRWGFANHRAETFRPHDLVVVPDGTTPNGSGGFNLMGEPEDAERVLALLDDIESRFSVEGVYLYGHSQGAFFATYFAGLHPDRVDGIVAHNSGIWNWTRLAKKGHAQAIVLMHGTFDPVVPYRQSAGGIEALRKAKYPMARLRSLEGWNHWPAEHNFNGLGQAVPHTSQQLAWVEGMTTQRPERLRWCFEFLAENAQRERADYAGIRSLALRVSESEHADAKLQRRARRVVEAVDELAEKHVKELDMPKKLELEDEAWVAHLMRFLRTFDGVPARDALWKKWGKKIEKVAEAGAEHMAERRTLLARDADEEAFEAGLDAIEEGFLCTEVADWNFVNAIKERAGVAESLGFDRKLVKRAEELIETYEDALKDGRDAFDRVNRKGGELPE